MRQSIEPTYDSRETGPRYTIETRIDDRRLDEKPMPDPFVHHRVILGWHDLLRGLIRRRLVVTVIVGGDPGIVDDVMELDANCLTYGSTRRRDWNQSVNAALMRVGSEALSGKPDVRAEKP